MMLPRPGVTGSDPVATVDDHLVCENDALCQASIRRYQVSIRRCLAIEDKSAWSTLEN
jgi:hypothetical protein